MTYSMICTRQLVFLCGVFIFALADERHECQKEHQISFRDFRDTKESRISEKVLCYMKCAFVKKGVFDVEARINMEKINEILEDWAYLSHKGKSYAIPCLEGLGAVKTCLDVKPIHLCIENAREFQLLKKCHRNNSADKRDAGMQ